VGHISFINCLIFWHCLRLCTNQHVCA